jgi:hypothetical protein
MRCLDPAYHHIQIREDGYPGKLYFVPSRNGTNATAVQAVGQCFKKGAGMKKVIRYSSMVLGAAMLIQLQGCYGNFNLTRKVYAWNGSLGDKWIKSVVMFVLFVIPVYGVAGLVDYVLLNTIEFWTGSNPVTLRAGEKEVQIVQWKGGEYKLTATTNRLDVEEITVGKQGRTASLIFDIRTQSWIAASGASRNTIIEMVGEDGQIANLIHPDGHKQRVELALE